MRIVTNGEMFAIVRRRWIFTQFWNHVSYEWRHRGWDAHNRFAILYWIPTKERAEELLQKLKNKHYLYYWDVE